jgi:type VI secretion system protein ImpF
MSELLLQEKLQPSLLDRLTDNEPDVKVESRDQRVLSISRLRACVLRDVAWLLSTTQLSVTESLAEHSEVSRSVLNFGMPDLPGTYISGRNIATLEQALTEALRNYEPRIIADTVSCRIEIDDARLDHRSVVFTITGEMWAQPIPQALYLKTEVDLETGGVTVSDYQRRP